MTTAFVAGATGFVGRAVVERLQARGATAIAHVRPDSSKLGEARKRFGDAVDTTAWDFPALAATMKARAVTHVFVCIGTTRSQAKRDAVEGDRSDKVDYLLTQMLCDAAVACGTNPRIVYLSAAGTGPNAGSAYYRARHKAEEAVRATGLPWVIARPAIIAGAGDGARRDDGRPMEKVAAVVGDGLLAVAGVFSPKTRAKWRSITPELLAAAMVRGALDGEPGRVLEGADLR